VTDELDDHTNLRRLIEEHFDLPELRDLCTMLDVDYDQLGEGLPKFDRVRALVKYMERRGRLPDLINTCRTLRPHVTWPHFPEPTETPYPYKGLYAFQEEDAHLFFGRDEAAQEVIQAVTQRSFTAIIGPSGSGKSSLVFAKVLPKLRQDGTWEIVEFRPGEQPFYNLADSIVEIHRPGTPDEGRKKLANWLQNGDVSLLDVATSVLKKEARKTDFLLVVDQFEELFSSCLEERRSCFLNTLLSLIAPTASGEVEVRAHLLITLRADFLGQALGYRPLADALRDNRIRLEPMSRDDLRQAIVEPISGTNIEFDERLAERILDDIAPDDSQPKPGDLPILELVLTQLWEQQQDGRLTHTSYEVIGRAQGVLADHAENVFTRLRKVEQRQLREMLLQLVHPVPEETRLLATRRLANRSELGESNWQLGRELAGSNARLVITGRSETGNQDTAELVHEALIQRWDRLRGWIKEYHAFRSWQERLRMAITQWEDSGEATWALLRDMPLAEANSWLAKQGKSLNSQEQTYIKGRASHNF
jgi:hypothetical protein